MSTFRDYSQLYTVSMMLLGTREDSSCMKAIVLAAPASEQGCYSTLKLSSAAVQRKSMWRPANNQQVSLHHPAARSKKGAVTTGSTAYVTSKPEIGLTVMRYIALFKLNSIQCFHV